MNCIEAFGYYHEVPEPEYDLSDVWAWKRETFPIIWDVTIYGQEAVEDVIIIEGRKYLVDERMQALIPFVAVEELD